MVCPKKSEYYKVMKSKHNLNSILILTQESKSISLLFSRLKNNDQIILDQYELLLHIKSTESFLLLFQKETLFSSLISSDSNINHCIKIFSNELLKFEEVYLSFVISMLRIIICNYHNIIYCTYLKFLLPQDV